jgi:hypothetical protein
MRSEGNFNSEQCVHFFKIQVMPCAEEHFPDLDFNILQENRRIHTSFQTMAYLLLRSGVNQIIRHAPKSSDGNFFENLF